MERGALSSAILIAIGAATALLVVVAVFFALQPPTEFDPDSPEGAAQGYFREINDGDDEGAEDLMTDDLRQSCDGQWWYEDMESASHVIITDTTIDGDTARVGVDITISYGDEPFGGGSYDQSETINMERVGEAWLISKPAWPMDRYACGERG